MSPAFTSVRERNAALVCAHNKLCAAKRFAEWSELFQPVCEFTAAYQVPPVRATVVGRENLFGFLSGPRRFALRLAAAVGELRVTPVALFQTDDPDVVINQHRLSVDLLDRDGNEGGRYEIAYISVIRIKDGLDRVGPGVLRQPQTRGLPRPPRRYLARDLGRIRVIGDRPTLIRPRR